MRKIILSITAIASLLLISTAVFGSKNKTPKLMGGAVDAVAPSETAVSIAPDAAVAVTETGLQLYPDVPEEINGMDFQCNFAVKTMGVVFDNLGNLVANIPMPITNITSYKSYGLRNGQSYTFLCVDAEQYLRTDIATTILPKARIAPYFLQEKTITLNFQPINLNNIIVTSAASYQIEKTKVLNEILKLQTTTTQINAVNDLAKISEKEVCRFVFVPSSNNLLKDYLISAATALKNNQCL